MLHYPAHLETPNGVVPHRSVKHLGLARQRLHYICRVKSARTAGVWSKRYLPRANRLLASRAVTIIYITWITHISDVLKFRLKSCSAPLHAKMFYHGHFLTLSLWRARSRAIFTLRLLDVVRFWGKSRGFRPASASSAEVNTTICFVSNFSSLHT